jgi:pyrroloquinoline quinone (PQQ) biosynthesis protein C
LQEDRRLEQLSAILLPLRSQSSALLDIAANGLSLPVAKELARQYYPANSASPQIMSSGISQIWDEGLRHHLVCNLYDESGGEDVKQSHIALLERFVRGVGIDPKSIQRIPGSPADKLIQTFLGTCLEGPDYRALAILHSFEDLFAPLCGLIAAGIEKSGVVDHHTGEFFRHHAVADILHAERMRIAMLQAADSELKWRECLVLVERGANLLFGLFDGVARTK